MGLGLYEDWVLMWLGLYGTGVYGDWGFMGTLGFYGGLNISEAIQALPPIGLTNKFFFRAFLFKLFLCHV